MCPRRGKRGDHKEDTDMEENRELLIKAAMDENDDVEVELNFPDDPIKGLTMLEISAASFFRILLPNVEDDDRAGLVEQFVSNLSARLEEELDNVGEYSEEDFESDDFEAAAYDDAEDDGFEVAPGVTININ
jgi:hypothetical protein